MHRALLIPEILFNIFGLFFESLDLGKSNLALLARTCRAFKEPALDLLWEELLDISPLVRCLPEALCRVSHKKRRPKYSFSRQLNESEWNVLRGYTCRVRYIRSSTTHVDISVTRAIFTEAPFIDPLFPNLRSLDWSNFTILPAVHAIVPSLTSLHLQFWSLRDGDSLPTEFLDIVGERCRYMEDFCVYYCPVAPFDAEISRQVCRWTGLRFLTCLQVSLSADAILHLASISTLKHLSFTLGVDLPDYIAQSGTILVFSNLSLLQICSASLTSVTRFFSYIRLPTIKDLNVGFSNRSWKQDIQAYWTALEQACPSNTLRHLRLFCECDGTEDLSGLEEQLQSQLTLDDLSFYRTFCDLDEIYIDLPGPVKLTDANLLDLVYESPRLTYLAINPGWGWRPDGDRGGITLDGLMQLLRCYPSLRHMNLAIGTETFTYNIPQWLDVGFPPDMDVKFLDSHILPEWVPRLASLFVALKLDSWTFDIGIRADWDSNRACLLNSLWNNVRDAMKCLDNCT